MVEDAITISMETYIKDIVGACGPAVCHRGTTPMIRNALKVLVLNLGEPPNDNNAIKFRVIIKMIFVVVTCV